MRKYEVGVYRRDRYIKRKSIKRGKSRKENKKDIEEERLRILQNGSLCSLLFALLAIFGYHKAQEKYINLIVFAERNVHGAP